MSDTKELQKEINSLSGKLDRTFAVTDELVFKVRDRPVHVQVGMGLAPAGPGPFVSPKNTLILGPGSALIGQDRVALW